MARINIEDKLFKDDRFINLCIRCGGRASALGELTSMWIVAQQFYLSHGEIPNEVWVQQNLSEHIITSGMAYRTETGVKARGQDEHFKWLRANSNAGKNSADARRKKKGSAQPKTRTTVRPNPEPRSTVVEPRPTSSSFSLSSSPSGSRSRSTSEQERPSPRGNAVPASPPEESAQPDESAMTPAQRIIAAYHDGFSKLYHSRPVLDGKALGTLKSLVTGKYALPVERAEMLLETYFRMKKRRYVDRRHDVGTFKLDLTAIGAFADTGSYATETEAAQADRTQTNANAFGPLIADARAREAAHGQQ